MKQILTLPILLSMLIVLSGGKFIFSQKLNHLFINDSLIAEFISDVEKDSVENHIQFLQDMGTRFMIAPNRKEVAESIKARFQALGVQEVRIDSFYATTKINYGNLQFDTLTTQYNIVATIPGIIDFDNFWIMGAHYDCVVAPEGNPMVFAPGADDNASGVAALFEVARIFSQHEYQPTNTIELVAFGAEELMYFGESGAQAYVDTALANNINLELMINNDMIGHTLTDNWEITISNYVDSEWLTDIAEQITNDFTSIEPLVRNLSDEAGADCKYFYEAGVPCLYFMEKDFNPYYHTDNDLITNSDMEYCAEAIKLSVGVLLAAEDTTTTRVNDNMALSLKFYPNPANEEFKISGLNTEDQFDFYVYDMQGREVKQVKIPMHDRTKINIRQLPDGAYIICCISKNQVYHGKIVKSRY